MNNDKLNQIAALLDGKLTPAEQEQLLSELTGNVDANRALASAASPDSHENSIPELPFPLSGLLRLGVCQDFLLPVTTEEVDLQGTSEKFVQNVFMASRGLLPAVFNKQVSYGFSSGETHGVVRVETNHSPGGPLVKVSLHGDPAQSGYLEVWRGNNLFRVVPASESVTEPLAFTISERPLAIRHSAAFAGVGLRVSAIEFTEKDWVGAAVACAVKGDFSTASQVFQSVLPVATGNPQPFQALQSVLEGFRALTRVESFILRPAPAFRSASDQSRNPAFKPVCSMLTRRWPELEGLQDYWDQPFDMATKVLGNISGLDEDVRMLTVAALGALNNRPWSAPSNLADLSPDLQAAWASLQGYLDLSEARYEAALAVFEGVAPKHRDALGAALSRNLLNCSHRGSSTDQLEHSTTEVWQQVITDISPMCL